MLVKTESPLHRDYIFIYIEKHHVSVENSDDCIIFTGAETDNCKESGNLFKKIYELVKFIIFIL